MFTIVSDQRGLPGSICADWTDCLSGSCGLMEFTQASSRACCEGGEIYLLDVPWQYGDIYFCGNRPDGTACGSDRQCLSNRCIGGTCVRQRLADGETCIEGADCENRTCALESFTQNARKICCPSGEQFLLDVPYSYTNFWHCGNAPENTVCGYDLQCGSGLLCINGSCSMQQLDDASTCRKDSDCKSGACSR